MTETMTFELTHTEWLQLRGLPEVELVALAADLSVCPPESIDKKALLEACVPLIVERARVEGLPFSKYDREDLEALTPEHLTAIGRLQGIKGRVKVAGILKVGARVYRTYTKVRPDNPVALMLPMLLTAVARASMESSQ